MRYFGFSEVDNPLAGRSKVPEQAVHLGALIFCNFCIFNFF
jgi:hypothetical protein